MIQLYLELECCTFANTPIPSTYFQINSSSFQPRIDTMDKTVRHTSNIEWPVRLFSRFCEQNNRAIKYSDVFDLPVDPSVKLQFSFYPGFGAGPDIFSVILRESLRPVQLNIRFWSKSKAGEKSRSGKLELASRRSPQICCCSCDAHVPGSRRQMHN